MSGRRRRPRKAAPPLAGISVLDFTRVVSGPYCTMLLGDFGADVIKIEEPHEGDELRALGPPFVGTESVFFLSVNRNKKSIAVDLKDAADRRAVRRLVRSADVVVENFRPGVMDRLGLGYGALRRLNPRLVFCSISAFRPGSRYGDRPGYDLMISGLSGLMSITGEPGGAPLRPGVNLIDLAGGMNAAIGILLALVERDRTGCGQKVEVALMDSAMAVLGQAAAVYLNTGDVPGRRPPEDLHGQIVPYGTYRAADDAYVNVCVPNNRFWAAFCAALGLERLATDPRFETNATRVAHRAELVEILRDRFREEPRDQWIERLRAAGVPAGAVCTIDEAVTDPYLDDGGMLARLTHPAYGPITLAGIAVHLSRTPGSVRLPPPVLGEHTEVVLRERAPKRRALRTARIL